MYNKYKQRFAIKKFTVGVASVFIGGTALMATDVLPFDIVNVASANENTDENNAIRFSVENKNTNDYMENNKNEYFRVNISNNNEEVYSSVRLEVEHSNNMQVQIKGLKENEYSSTINNTTTLNIGEVNDETQYNIPIFIKYKEKIKNNTSETIKIKLVDNTTNQVLKEEVVNVINKAKEIIALTPKDKTFNAGTFNTATNTVDNSGTFYYKERLLDIDKELLNEEFADGGDYVKYTIEDNTDIYSITKNYNNEYELKINNVNNKITTPARIKAEVFDSNNISKNIVAYFNMSPVWKDISNKTEYLNENISGEVSPIIKSHYNTNHYGEDIFSKYIDDISSLKEGVKTDYILGSIPNNNTIKYELTSYNPKDYSLKIEKDSPLAIDKNLKINVFFNKTISNLDKAKIWYKTKSNNEKQYMHNGKTLLEILKEKPEELLLPDYDSNLYSYYVKSMISELTWDQMLKIYNLTDEDVINDLYDKKAQIELNYKYNNDVNEIGIEFSDDTIVTSDGINTKNNYIDDDLKTNRIYHNIDASTGLSFDIRNKYNVTSESENDSLIYKANVLFNDNVLVSENVNVDIRYNKDIIMMPILSNLEKYKTEKLNTLKNEKITMSNNSSVEYTLLNDKNIQNIKLLISKTDDVNNNVKLSSGDIKSKKLIELNGKKYNSYEFNDSVSTIDIKFEETPYFIHNRKNDDYYISENIDFLIQIPTSQVDKVSSRDKEWVIVPELTNSEITTYKYISSLSFNLVFPEELKISDSIENVTTPYKKVEPENLLKVTTNVTNYSKQSVNNIEVIQKIPNTTNSALGTVFERIDIVPDNWNVFYSTDVSNNINDLTWTQEQPTDTHLITYIKWVNNSTNAEINTPLSYFAKTTNNYNSVISPKIKTESQFKSSNNNSYVRSESSIEIKEPVIKVKLNMYIDNNKNGEYDSNDTKIDTNVLKTNDNRLNFNYVYSFDENNNLIIKDSVFLENKFTIDDFTFTKLKDPIALEKIANHRIENTVYSLVNNTPFVTSPEYKKENIIELDMGIQLSDEKTTYKIIYYDIETKEIVKEETVPNIGVLKKIGVPLKEKFEINKTFWSIDADFVHSHPVSGEEYKGADVIETDDSTSSEKYVLYTHNFSNNPNVYIPVKADKAGKVDVILKDKETGEPLKITNLVTENTEKKGTTVTITDTVAPNYITIGDNTYKKVEKPNLPTEAIVPGETDNADVEFEYELVRGAVYGVFKAENGNNIVKDKVTIIEGGQPEDTRVEYTAPSKITDDNGKVWELVSPKETVSYTNSEKATEHILTYREVKKNITVKYVTESGEVIKEETAFENKSVGSKYTINTPETITKDNVIYNVSGEREVSRVVEDNDNIVTIQVTPKQKQVAIVKFVDNNGEEIAGIERKRVEGYDGTPINVTLNNISNYRITTNPFETPQVFDTDNNVDQEFNVVLEKIPTTAIPFETEYVADNTREYGSENILEREGEEGVREENGEITKQPVNKIVKVATGSKVERKETPFNVIYEADESKSFGDNTTETGKNKVEEITTTYTLDSSTGNVTSETSTTVVENGSPEIHKLGTKAKTEVEAVEYKTEYVEDKTLEYGKEKVITEGVAGEKTTTTTYRLDGDTVVANDPIVEITKQSTNKVVAKGTKATETVIKETPFTTITKEDSTLNKGEEVVEVEGVNGKTVTITEYTLNKETGEVTSTTREEVREAVNKVVRVGTKETTTNVETDTPTAEEEKAKEDKNSDAWEETANEYNKQKETVETKDNLSTDKKETITNEQSKENNSEVKVENKVVQDAEVKAKELPKTNTNSTLLYSATALIGLATLLRRKQNQ